MGKLPAVFVTVLAIWLAWNALEKGPDSGLSALLGLVREPQYGEADRPTRSGDLADRVLEVDASGSSEGRR